LPAYPGFITAGLSHPGERREINEDRFAIESYRLGRTHCLLVVVSDGIGGHLAGEVAAELTVHVIRQHLTTASRKRPTERMHEAILSAGEAVLAKAGSDPQFEGMGATVALAWILGDRLYTGHVGDSRIYLLRDDRLHQLTTDHTWIQEAIDRQIIRPEEARNHPYAHMLQRAIGGNIQPEPDFRMRMAGDKSDAQSESHQGMRLKPGDQLLLCTDGLTDLVEDGEIAEALRTQEPEQAAQSLITLARARGGHDNITVVILKRLSEKIRIPRQRSALTKVFIWLSIPLVLGLIALGLALLRLLGLWSGF
jgi:protein phosphatase